ncbi:MAG: murein biosynthesis integral membrane protein MurJ [Paludibacter sp.]
MDNKKSGLVKSTLLITFCSILGIVISFASQMIIAYYFGAKFERDAYFVASTIPIYLSAIFMGSIGVVFLPKIVNLKNINSSELTIFLSTLFWIISFIASGFNIEQTLFTSKILIIIIPTFIFSIINNLLSSLYQIENRFFYPALAPIITAIVSLIFVIIFSGRIGIFGLAFGFLIGSIISFIYLLPILKTYKIKFLIDLKDPELFFFFKTFIPLLLAGVLFRSTNIFERSIASNLEAGSISYLGYSSQILAILATLTSSGIGVSIYPTLSKLWTTNKKHEFNNFFTKIIRILLLFSIPISFVTIFWGDIFIKLVFERGAFNHNVTIAVSRALAWSMGAFIFQNLGNVVSKLFYISGKTTMISIIGSIELLLYVVFGYLFTKHFSFVGLAIALSLSSMINIILSVFFINRTLIKLEFKLLFREISKILVSTSLSILVVYLLYYHAIGINGIIYLLFSLLVGLITFLISGYYFGIEEIIYLKAKFITVKN